MKRAGNPAFSMSRKLHIAREGIELGTLTTAETRELLRTEYLLPTDFFWTAGMPDWKPLAEWDSPAAEETESPDYLALARQHVTVAGGRLAAEAVRLRDQFKSAAAGNTTRLTENANRMLHAFTPQIQRLVTRQVVEQSATRLQALLRNEDLMRKLFGATYDCLPRPVRRFVSEPMFITFCLERRRELLGLPAADGEETSQADHPPA